MSEDLIIKSGTKKEKYNSLIPQIKALVEGEPDMIANISNICSALKYGMEFFWVGFYFIKEGELVLGPFQGPPACTRISKGRGVCGTAWQENKTIIVDDVDKFPGHISCSSSSKSEIVIPIYNSNNNICGVLDVDSDMINSFDDIDKHYLEELTSIIKPFFG